MFCGSGFRAYSDRSRRGRVARLAATVLLILPLVGCPTVDKGVEVLEQGIAAVQAAPGNWQATVSTLVSQLGKEGSALADKVQAVFTHALGQATGASMCGMDFFGHRVADALQTLLHQVNELKPAPALRPVVCLTDPAVAVEAGKTSIATFYGYDFQDYSKVSAFTANVEYDGDVVAMAGVGHVSVATNYQMSVDVQAVDFGGLDRSRGPRLVLRWKAGPVSAYSGGAAALPILVPVPKVPRTSTVSFLVSQHARNGGLFSGGQCLSVDTTYNVAAGWVVDTTKGDPYHPGISETSVRDNQQSKNSLRAYNYQAISMTAVTVSGTICGAGNEGPGAIFERTYTVYLVEAA